MGVIACPESRAAVTKAELLMGQAVHGGPWGHGRAAAHRGALSPAAALFPGRDTS